MTSPTLPVDGQTPWGDELNTGILQVNTTANNAQAAISSHASNIPADPHGDRAYAQSLVTPITTGVNAPNGFVQLTSTGKLPASLVTGVGGAFTNVYDVVAQYGAVAGTGADQSVAIQSALTACGTAGGGIVWVGPGVFSLANYLVMSSNTWLIMSEGTVLSRISGSPTTPYMITNISFTSGGTPASNIRITGGKLDAVGTSGLAVACRPIYIFQATKGIVEDIIINNVPNNSAVEINGSSNITVQNMVPTGAGTNSSVSYSAPAIRISNSRSSITPSGLSGGFYNNQSCNGVLVSNVSTPAITTTYGPYGALVASDLNGSGSHTGIIIKGCNSSYTFGLNFFNPAVSPNSQWSSYSVSGCIFADNISANPNGWFQNILTSGYSNSGQGPSAQYRLINQGTYMSSGTGEADTVEIIGDISVGTTSSGTEIFALPSNLTFNSPQVIPVVFPTYSGATVNCRMFLNNSTNQVQAEGFPSGAAGQRLTYHAYLSLTA